MKISVDALVKRFEKIKGDRSTWESHWQELTDYCLPQKATITNTREPGTKIKTDIYDSTAIQSAQILAAGLHSYLTNPASRWFGLAMKNRALVNNQEVKVWLNTCEDGIFDHLNNSNFNQQIHEGYIDFGVMGTTAIYSERDVKDGIIFFTRPMSEVYILANSKGRIDTAFRYFIYTARQAFQKWGENSGKKVLDLIEAGDVEKPVLFLHIVLPREERDVSKKDSINMPWASLYIEPKTRKVLSESGYHEFPFFFPRFYKVSDSEYGYSPASICLPDIKMLNSMRKVTIKKAQIDLDPPKVLPHDGFLLPLKTGASAVNFKLSSDPNDKIEFLNTKSNFSIAIEEKNETRDSIKKTFFVDLFLMLTQNTDMTATEVLERVNEKMLILGPVLGRLMHELLGPIVERTFSILMRDGRLPQPPDILKDEKGNIKEDYQINYISPLAKAQRAAESRSLVQLFEAIKAMKEIDPTVVDNFNVDKAAHEFQDIFNAPADVMNSDEVIKSIREQRQEQAEQQALLEQVPQAAAGAKEIAGAVETIKGGGNAKNGQRA